MTTGVSLVAMQWLYWLQSTDECIDSQGNRIQLQHKYHRGEKKIGPYEVDGYMEKDGEHYFYEFNGCKFHPGCCVPDSEILNAKSKRRHWIGKEKYLRSIGTLYVITECEWEIMIRNQCVIDSQTDMPRIMVSDTQESLLEAISSGEVFGFAVLDLETPESVRESFGDFLFPPIIQKMKVTEDMLSPYMEERVNMRQGKCEFDTLVQTYNGKQLFLITPLIQFYLKLGLVASNVTQFIQYIPGKALKPFTQKVYNMRCDASREKDEAKSTTAKLFGNSGYGKTGENVESHTRVKYVDEKNVWKEVSKPFFKKETEITNENGEPILFEMKFDKKIVKDDKPVHFCVAILQYSKLLFMNFMYFLHDHLEPGSFKPVYCDTGKIMLF